MKPKPTVAALRRYLARKRFRAYLEAQPEGVEVGLTGYSTQCPLARYAARLGRSAEAAGDRITVSVMPYLESFPRDETAIPTPRWASAFIDRIDTAPFQGISREVALVALASA